MEKLGYKNFSAKTTHPKDENAYYGQLTDYFYALSGDDKLIQVGEHLGRGNTENFAIAVT
ncbi:hypothetical protein GCM10007876_13130 [Litoribrevibacter albus]|uniref:Uncharacterized protein n=1 Tax=Litoribrevibacter albus TaxID=1473156 RepID=A0AA37S9A2_9GAMM|nr:hypothetical protein GCM10007876_13130 [Litoribrevibacter albus]